MSKNRADLLGVYVDGETKTGKGAASEHIASVLKQKSFNVYYDVAGNFFRRYVALLRDDMGLHEEEVLVPGPDMELAAQRIIDEGRVPFEQSDEFGDLQRPAISESVSVLGKLASVQDVSQAWWAATVKRAWETEADILVIDARNPRSKIAKVTFDNVELRTALDLYMTCDPIVAAKRSLAGNGVVQPSPAQIQQEVINVINRRELDRSRTDNPFVEPAINEAFTPGTPATEAIRRAWKPHAGAELPVTIVLDNSLIAKEVMLEAVSDLSLAAVEYLLAEAKRSEN